MSSKDILVPNIGDFKDVEVIEVLVKIGQKIKKNDSLITIESDKSSVEVPSTHEGVIEKINVKIGNTTISRKPTKKKSRTNTNGNKKNSTVRKLNFDNTTNNVPNTFKELLEQNEKNEKAKKNKK